MDGCVFLLRCLYPTIFYSTFANWTIVQSACLLLFTITKHCYRSGKSYLVVEEQEVATGVSLSIAFPAPAEGSKKSIRAPTIDWIRCFLWVGTWKTHGLSLNKIWAVWLFHILWFTVNQKQLKSRYKASDLILEAIRWLVCRAYNWSWWISLRMLCQVLQQENEKQKNCPHFSSISKPSFCLASHKKVDNCLSTLY